MGCQDTGNELRGTPVDGADIGDSIWGSYGCPVAAAGPGWTRRYGYHDSLRRCRDGPVQAYLHCIYTVSRPYLMERNR